MTIVSTYMSETTETLSANGDDLVVTSSGSIVNDDGADGVDSTAASQTITIDGLVYSVDNGAAGTAVEIAGSGTYLYVNGQVQGDAGVIVDDANSVNVYVGAQGSLAGLDGSAIQFEGNIGSPSPTYYGLSNAGDISASAGADAVFFDDGGEDLITNTGEISGQVAVEVYANVATETVENSGTITGDGVVNTSAIMSRSSSAGIDIINSGLLTDGAANTIGPSSALIFFDDNSGTTSTIDNTGTISGSGYVIQSISDILDISNSGTIHGGLYSTAGVDVDNSGLWKGQAGSAVVVFDLTASDNAVTNSKTGAIDGGITIASGGDTITNAGAIDGAVTFTGTPTVANTFTNSGEITGSMTFSSGFNTLDNSGAIDGAISFAHAGDLLTNTGSIDGAITINGGGTITALSNSGAITGNVAVYNTNTIIANHGEIYGNVTATTDDTLTNTGTIHGNVTLGASDTVVELGDITGTATASTNDLFEFSGNFGDATVASFLAGSGSTHDTIQFAANDFSTFSQVQSASTQQGADVVIRLDGTDSITLAGVTLSSLVSADFKFV